MHHKKKIKCCFTNDYIISMNKNDIASLSQKEISSFTLEHCELLSFDQLDCFSMEQLSFFTPPQKKVLCINIVCKPTEEIQKINLNALSDKELKSLLKHQIESLNYEQIINILPYIWQGDKILPGTISNFRPKQYSFFTKKQLQWMTMYQVANIPKRYLSDKQIKYLTKPCFLYPKDTLQDFIPLNDIQNFNTKCMTLNQFKYLSSLHIKSFTKEQIANIPRHFLDSEKDS
jgi:hypothetical protein